ncbi:alpha/beta hydrolase fold domain-containing protein [Nonomuraea sp. NPDC050783]|uniref:alpha/beta hydrolase fold domain-containing protein n=1 Tax=Nonomuraea sp. NPDC050783 TaxID=3154634 RepID=UPI0034654B3F
MTPSGFPADLLAPPDPIALPLPPPAYPEGPDVRVLRGAVYALRDGTRPLELDLWLPPEGGPEPAPLVVLLHGGGWRKGMRGDLGPRLRGGRPGPPARLARAGLAVACPAYRLSGEAVHPAQLDDVTAALAWLRARAPELGVDPGRTVLWGESAGGHLAALAALTVPGTRGCVTWYAPTDLAALAADHAPGRYDPADPGTFEALMLGAPPAEAPERARAASPVAHVTPSAPPFLIMHGTADTRVPAAQGRRLAEALRAAGVRADLRPVEGADHLWAGIADEAVEECFTTSLAFVQEVVALWTRPPGLL